MNPKIEAKIEKSGEYTRRIHILITGTLSMYDVGGAFKEISRVILMAIRCNGAMSDSYTFKEIWEEAIEDENVTCQVCDSGQDHNLFLSYQTVSGRNFFFQYHDKDYAEINCYFHPESKNLAAMIMDAVSGTGLYVDIEDGGKK